MTTDAVPAAIVPPHPAWRSLLWTIAFTVLRTWLIYSLPVLLESGLPALTVRLMVHGLIALGLWLGLERTDLTPGQRRTTWLAIMVPFTAIALATGTAEGRKAAILWNIFGIADLVVAIALGMIISPGPFQLIVPNILSIGIDGYPNVLTPAFVVPGSILLHALSLRQLRRRSRTEAVGR